MEIDRGGAGSWSWGAKWNEGVSPKWNEARQRRLTAWARAVAGINKMWSTTERPGDWEG